MLSPKLWDQEKYEHSLTIHPELRKIAQSKGKCKMVVCPKKGDSVVFVYKKKIVMKGYLDSDGFVSGTDHRVHSCNTGNTRPHTEPSEFAWVHITETGLSQDIRCTGQRTWAKI
jgi:hypothetical protein